MVENYFHLKEPHGEDKTFTLNIVFPPLETLLIQSTDNLWRFSKVEGICGK